MAALRKRAWIACFIRDGYDDLAEVAWMLRSGRDRLAAGKAWLDATR